MSRFATAFLSTDNLIHNVNVVKTISPQSKIIAMVKANAYGHGLRSVSLRLAHCVDMLGVASIDEALILRDTGINLPILLCEGVFEESELAVAAAYNFHVVLHNEQQIFWIKNRYYPIPLNCWLKMDSGMNRLGFDCNEIKKYYQELLQCDKVAKPIAIMSHFSCADQITHPTNILQCNRIDDIVREIDTTYSFCNSAALINMKQYHFDYVRPGIMLYGISPVDNQEATKFALKPVMTLKSRIIAVKNIIKGDAVGYCARFVAEKNMRIAIVAFGYGDGYPITVDNDGYVLVKDQRCRIVGRVSMDMMAIDVSNLPQISIGDDVILWGEKLLISEIANHTSQISWSLLSAIQNRVKFYWIQSKDE